MKIKTLNLIVAFVLLIPLLLNAPKVDAAPLLDPPKPGPLYEDGIKSNPCFNQQTSVGVLIGADEPVFTCSSFLPITDALQIQSLVITGADPKYGLTGIPLAYAFKYEPIQSMGKRMDGNNKKKVCVDFGWSAAECYNDFFMWVVVVPGVVDDPHNFDPRVMMNGSVCYGNVCPETPDGNSMRILKTYGLQQGNYWDSAVKMSVEAWRQGNYSNLVGATSASGRSRDNLESLFRVNHSALGTASTESFPGESLRWYMTYTSPDYFTAVMSMTSSQNGSTSTPAGEKAFSLKFKQTWTIFVRQGWSSVDRRLDWTERVCNADPNSTILNPLPDICNNEHKSKWYNNVGAGPYDSDWKKLYTYDRYRILDKTTGGRNGYTGQIAIPYYQTQPLLTDR